MRPKFSVIDDLARPLHHWLTANDQCIYLYERTTGRGYDFSAANNLIANLKKKPGIASAAEMRYKDRDIRWCSTAFSEALNPYWLEHGTFVPVPPSKAKGHPQYDDRMERICRGMGPNVDVRNLVVQNVSMTSSHERPAGDRIGYDELLANYRLEEQLADPTPTHIAIVDDLLTAGTHFRAMHTVLARRFPNAIYAGVFVARRVFPDENQIDL